MAEGVGIEPTQGMPEGTGQQEVTGSGEGISYRYSYSFRIRTPHLAPTRAGTGVAAPGGTGVEVGGPADGPQGSPRGHESDASAAARRSGHSRTSDGHGAAVGPRFKLRDLRRRCVDCIGGPQRATRCDQQDCELWDYRTGHRPKGGGAKRTPLRALRSYCVWCCEGQYREVRLCPAFRCALWPWRLGRATGQERPAGDETGGVEGE